MISLFSKVEELFFAVIIAGLELENVRSFLEKVQNFKYFRHLEYKLSTPQRDIMPRKYHEGVVGIRNIN